MDAELLVAGTLLQAETLISDHADVYYTLVSTSYVHYAPEEFVNVDPSLILSD